MNVAIVVASMLSGFYAGYSVKSTRVDAEKGRILTLEREQLIQSHEKNKELTSALIASRAKVEVVYEVIEKEVPVYVTKIQKVASDCNLTNGTVSLLDKASAGDAQNLQQSI
jgi:hypothetical protein